MTYMYTLRKWAVWLGVTGYLLVTVLGIQAWRYGVLKYGCMQETTPSMMAHYEFLHYPLTGLFADTMTAILCLNLVAMVVDRVFGARVWSRICDQLMTAKTHLWLPLLAASAWIFLQQKTFGFSQFLPSMCFYLFFITFFIQLGNCKNAE
jgi:hypothetical protein